MSLSARLAAVHGTTPDAGPAPLAPVAVVPPPEVAPPGGLASRLARAAVDAGTAVAPVDSGPRAIDTLTRLKDRASKALFERLGSKLADADIPEEQLHALVRADLQRVIGFEQTPLSAEDKARLIHELTDEVLGYGPLQPLLDDPTVTEVMVNGPDTVYVEQAGRIVRTTAAFASEEHLRRVIERIVSRVGRRIEIGRAHV